MEDWDSITTLHWKQIKLTTLLNSEKQAKSKNYMSLLNILNMGIIQLLLEQEICQKKHYGFLIDVLKIE